MKSRTRTSGIAQLTVGTPWAITDRALQLIDDHLAIPAPERGAALIAARDSRLIIDAVIDPRPGQVASYWHSDQLRERLSAYLADNPALRYVGTVHSHPGGYAEPSGPDHDAFANMLRTNPEIRDAVFPIVVQKRREALGAVLRLGTEHLIDLPHGTFAGYSAHPTDSGLVVRPAPMHVVPAYRHCDEVAAALAERFDAPTTVRWGQPLTVSGTSWLTAHFTVDGDVVAGVALGPSYPATPPMAWTAESASPSFPAWPPAASGSDLIDAVGELLTKPAQTDTVSASQIRAGIQERLAVHLPNLTDPHVLLVGAGSVGSNAAEMLVRSGVRRLTVVDFDKVEPANMSRTVYSGADPGRLKVEALSDRLTSIAPDVELTLVDSPLQELTDAHFDGVDLAFLASDDMAGEAWLNHALYLRAIPFVSVKLFAGAQGAELAYVVPAQNTACLRCMMGSLGSAERGDVDYGTGRVQGSPALGPDIVAATARGVKVALALTQPDGPLHDWVEQLRGRRLTYFLSSNVAGWQYTEFAHPGSLPFDGIWLAAPGCPDCEICGENRCSTTDAVGVGEFTAEPPSGESVSNADGQAITGEA
jgi:molybdopterin/thiamine biosynthesis adenylyltransferase